MATLTSRSSSWALDPRATGGFTLAFFILLAVDVGAYFTTVHLTRATNDTLEVQAVSQGVQEVLNHLLDAETGQRGYLLTGDEAYLEPYRKSIDKVEPILRDLRQRISADWVPLHRLDELELLVARKQAELKHTLAARQTQGVDFALHIVRGGEGREVMDDIRQIIRDLTNEANVVVQERASAVQRDAHDLYAGILAGNLLTLALGSGAVLLLNRNFIQRRAAEDALKQSRDELEIRVRARTADLSQLNSALQTEVVQRRQTEERVSQLAAIVESSRDAIIGTNLDGLVLTWNAGAEQLYGYGADEMRGRPLQLLDPPQTPDDWPRLLEQVRRGKVPATFDTQRVRKDGKPTAVSLTLSPIRDRMGRTVGVSAISRDISERRKLEAQLLQAQKMEAIGRLAAGVAHDFNNLLTIIIGFSDLLHTQLAEGSRERAEAAEVLKAGERAATLARQLLAFSRPQTAHPQLLDLNGVIAGLATVLPRMIGADVRLATVLQPDLRRVYADPGQIEQVLLNLTLNARDAMPDGGQLTLETQNVELDISYTRLHNELRPGSYVLLAVTDTGTGMTEEVRARIFEPFFTTKEKGKGTGLGLAMVYGIIKQAGGHATVYTEPGRGTTFKIYLPPRDAGSEPAVVAAPAGSLPTGTETVLVVEDDEAVRAIVGSVLRQHGYHLLEARDAATAMEAAASHQGRIDMLLVDVVLPEFSGRDVADRLTGIFPPMKVLFLSGYSSHAVVRHGVLERDMPFLEKPFTPHALASKVRTVLDSR
jgi:PAS domain S-box-containing protein